MIFVLRSILACVFLLSGSAKLYHYELAELAVAESGLFSWAWVSVVTKLLLAMELVLGVLILFNPLKNNTVYKLVIAVLVLFSLFLVWQMVFKSQTDCGCFPGLLEMSPLTALIRNLVMLLIAYILYKRDKPVFFSYSVSLKALFPILLLLAAAPFILYAYNQPVVSVKKGSVLPLEVMDNHPKKLYSTVKYDLKRGKHILAYVSLTCPNCKLSTKRLRILKDMYPSLPVVLILNGEKKFLKPFFEFTGAKHLDQIHFNGGKDYVRMSGLDLPNVLVVDNKIVIQQLEYNDLNEATIGKYIPLH